MKTGMRPACALSGRIHALVRDQWAGLIALFLVLSGGTALATGTIGPHDIQDDAVRTQHVRNGEIGSGDLANDSTGQAIRSTDVADQALGSSDIATNALKGADIDEASLDLPGFEVGDVEFQEWPGWATPTENTSGHTLLLNLDVGVTAYPGTSGHIYLELSEDAAPGSWLPVDFLGVHNLMGHYGDPGDINSGVALHGFVPAGYSWRYRKQVPADFENPDFGVETGYETYQVLG
jgi:hypothetical protein